MKLVIGFLIMLSLSCGKKTDKEDYQFVEPPTYEIVPSGHHAVVRWSKSKGDDVAGYKIYWDVLRFDGKTWFAEDFTKTVDTGLKRTHTFVHIRDTVIEMWLKAYDSRGNYSLASPIKYYPQKPEGYKVITPIKPLISDPWHGHLYKTGEDIELSWDEPESGPADSYEVKVELVNDDNHIATHIYPETSALSQNLTRPYGFVGLCQFFIRAKTAGSWSTWITGDSNDGQVKIDGSWTNTNWRLYWMLDAPSWE